MEGRFIEEVIDGEVYVTKSDEWRSQQGKALFDLSFSKTGLPPHVKDLTLSDYVGENRAIPRKLKKYVSEFGDRYRMVHLYFWSHKNGTQKTTTASIVGKLLTEKGFQVKFILMGELLSLLTKMSDNPTERQDLLDCDFLIIDDSFDRKKATIYRSGYQISFLDIFLRERLEVRRRATCFTSNFSIEEIDEEVFGRSLKKLVERSVQDPFEFDVLYSDRNDFDIDDLWK